MSTNNPFSGLSSLFQGPLPECFDSPFNTRDLLGELRSTYLDFGRHRGETLYDLGGDLVSYLTWCKRTCNEGEASYTLRSFCRVYADLIDAVLSHPDIIAHALSAEELEVDENSMSKGQTRCYKEIPDLVQKNFERGFASAIRVQGGAGTGKTYAVRAVLCALVEKGYYVNGIWAPSYVATCALESALLPLTLPVKTLAKGLKLRRVEIDADVYFLPTDKTDKVLDAFQPHHVIVVDECSMISDELALRILHAVLRVGAHLIMVGDRHQFPPIGEEEPNVFCRFDTQEFVPPYFTRFELTEPMRFKEGSELHRLERALVEPKGDTLRFTGVQSALLSLEGDAVHIVSGFSDLVDAYVASLPDDSIAVFWQKKDVVRFNSAVRERRYGTEVSSTYPVLQDELLRVVASFSTVAPSQGPVQEHDSKYPTWNGADIEDGDRYHSGTCYQVVNIKGDLIEGTFRFRTAEFAVRIPCYSVEWLGIGTGAPLDSRRANIIFAHDENRADEGYPGGREYTEALQQLKNCAEANSHYWPIFHRFKALFVPVQHGYAITAHRAQGSTRRHVFSTVHGIWSSDPIVGPPLRYVALTRGSKSVTVAL